MKKSILFLLLCVTLMFSTASKELTIVNTTKVQLVGQAVEIGSNILDLQNVKITVVKTPHKGPHQNYVTKSNNNYFLFLDPYQRKSRIVRIIAHELIHIKQYSENQLSVIDIEHISWKGETYNLSLTPYDMRPWEVEARQLEYRLKKQIEEQLNN